LKWYTGSNLASGRQSQTIEPTYQGVRVSASKLPCRIRANLGGRQTHSDWVSLPGGPGHPLRPRHHGWFLHASNS